MSPFCFNHDCDIQFRHEHPIEVIDWRARAEQAEKLNVERLRQIAEIRTELDAAHSQLEILSRSLDAAHEERVRLKAEPAAKDARITGLEKLVEGYEAAITELQHERETKDARIRELTEDLCRLDPSYKL